MTPPPIREVVELYDMLAPWSRRHCRWVVNSTLLEAMAEQYLADAPPTTANSGDHRNWTLMGLPFRIDESATRLLLEWVR